MKLAIVGIFYDGYYDMWEDFLHIFHANWPDCPYPVYIVNQEKELDFSVDFKITVLHAGKESEYSKKIKKVVDEIDADYYLLLLEDFFIGDKLEKDMLNPVLDFIERNNVKYFGFNWNLFGPDKRFGFAPTSIKKNSEYTIVSANNIFEREFLKRCVGDGNFNAWVFEGIYAKSKTAHTQAFLEGCFKNKYNFLHLYHGALQGKLLPHTIKHFEKENYSLKTKREVLTNRRVFLAKVKNLVKMIIPRFLLRFFKKILRKKGVLDRYSKQIKEESKKLGL